MKYTSIIGLGLVLCLLLACTDKTVPTTNTNTLENTPNMSDYGLKTPDWVKNANMYEVNLRQYTKEGTIKAFEAHLPRLKEMGVDILWFMPIHPIGVKKRKGTLGSYYSIQDYKGVNPDHGTLADFKSLVKKCHQMGMYVMLDWVANHSAWDNAWVTEHPDWYTYDNDTITHPLNEKGEPTGWTDVADLNYNNKAMRAAMIDALKYWVKECDIDGYRCDVAGFVPTDFWNDARAALNKEKTVFMLAEWEDPVLHEKAFEMTYGWEYHHLINDIAKGKKGVKELMEYYEKDKGRFPEGAIRLYFTSNHDENSWNGSTTERMGDARNALAVLSATFDGMPLVYSGQESDNAQRLEFFEKDEIAWGDFKMQEFYKKLLTLKRYNKALWNGSHGGRLLRIDNAMTESAPILGFLREKEGDQVVVFVNLSEHKTRTFSQKSFVGMQDIFTQKSMDITVKTPIELGPWEYLVLSNQVE